MYIGWIDLRHIMWCVQFIAWQCSRTVYNSRGVMAKQVTDKMCTSVQSFQPVRVVQCGGQSVV